MTNTEQNTTARPASSTPSSGQPTGRRTLEDGEKMCTSTQYEGKVQVCAHTVEFWYELDDLNLSDELESCLTEAAEERAQSCIIEGYLSGELNCLWRGEREIRGWWNIQPN